MKEWFNENWQFVATAAGAIVGFELFKLIFKKIIKKICRVIFIPAWQKTKFLRSTTALIYFLIFIIILLIIWNIYYMYI